MINKIHIQGFKCFDDEEFVLTPLTLLSGLNSSGKSTFLQAVRLMYEKSALSALGPVSELVSSLHKKMSITLTSSGGDYLFEYPESKNYDYPFVEPVIAAYISAARLGPELYLPVSQEEERGFSVGEKGEFVLDFLEHHSELAGLPDILRRREANSSSVRNNVSAWLGVISPGIKMEWMAIPKADLIRAEYSGHRPNNVGFGISYALPIIANVLVYAALVANGEQESTLLMIENPEAHLHPAGQTQLGEFLARAASCGVQIVVETHSDHLLNGIRLAVKNKILKAVDSTFYYFNYDFDEERTSVQQPIIDDDGFFDEWPDGFFDETEKNLGRIL